jgi:uncharacterized protein YuzE
MKLTYDPRYNIAYLRLVARAEGAQIETVQVSDELNVDIAPDGTVYGIELMNANAQLAGEDHGALTVVNEASGQRHELPIAQ